MNLRAFLIGLGCVAHTALLACATGSPPEPERLGENKYVFVVVPRGELVTTEQFTLATMRARAFCQRAGLSQMVSVEPDDIVEGGRELSVFHFTCEEIETTPTHD
jgi:hypothetical protein